MLCSACYDGNYCCCCCCCYYYCYPYYHYYHYDYDYRYRYHYNCNNYCCRRGIGLTTYGSRWFDTRTGDVLKIHANGLPGRECGLQQSKTCSER